jgi:predicted dehydrogenase
MLAWLENLPRPAPKNVTIRVKKTAERHLRHGHPWLFDQAIANQSHEGAAGDLVVAFDEKRGFLALGLYDPRSPIRVKVLHSKKPIAVDDAFFAGRIDAAIIATPPDTHFPLASRLLAAGRHVLCEKPFTVLPEDAEALVAQADVGDLRV